MVSGSDSTSQDDIVRKTVEGIKSRQITICAIMSDYDDSTWNSLLKENSKGEKTLNLEILNAPGRQELKNVVEILATFFSLYDTSKDNLINYEEYLCLLQDLKVNLEPKAERELFKSFDVDDSEELCFSEFVACIVQFALTPATSKKPMMVTVRNPTLLLNPDAGGDDEENTEDEDMPEDLADLSPQEQRSRLKKRAFSKLAFGTALVLVFSDPMCDNLTCMGTKLGVNPFYISFVLAPLASNASELVAAMKLASKRTMGSMANSLGSLEGAAIMNNTFCLAIFMILIVLKGLLWEFSAETLSILFVEVAIAIIVLRQKYQTVGTGLMIFSFYPLSLVLVLFLEKVCGLD